MLLGCCVASTNVDVLCCWRYCWFVVLLVLLLVCYIVGVSVGTLHY
jgi:hypothetical protein